MQINDLMETTLTEALVEYSPQDKTLREIKHYHVRKIGIGRSRKNVKPISNFKNLSRVV